MCLWGLTNLGQDPAQRRVACWQEPVFETSFREILALPRWAFSLTLRYQIVTFHTIERCKSPNFRLAESIAITYIFPNTFRVQEEREHMKDGKFVLDAHTGFWDASKENIKNEYGLAFAETFYAFQSGFNPPDPKWTMDFDKEFRKVDPDWYLHHMFVRGEMDMAILSTQVLMDFYHTGFTNSKRNAEMVARAPERLIGLGGVDPRDKNATRHMRE